MRRDLPTPLACGLATAVLVACSIALYARSMGNGLVLDDDVLLRQHFALNGLVFDSYYRPLTVATWAIFHPLADGTPQVRAAHAFNIFLNGAVVGAVFFLCFSLYRSARLAIVPAFAASLIFAFHPVHSEAVAQINARFDLMATLFTLLAVLAYLQYRRDARPLWLALTALSTLSAALSKESGLTVVPLLVVCEVLYRHDFSPPPAVPDAAASATRRGSRRRRRAEVRRDVPKPPLPFVAIPIALTAALGLYAVLRLVAGTGDQRQDFRVSRITPADSLGSLGFYAEKLVAPWHLVANYAAVRDGPIDLLKGVLFLAVLLALVVYAVRIRQPAFAFGLAWIFVTLVPSLAVLGYGGRTAPIAERYLYLPSVGIAICLTSLIVTAQEWAAKHGTTVPSATSVLRAGTAVAAVSLCIGGAWIVTSRIRDFRDLDTFWRVIQHDNPSVGRSYLYFGIKDRDAGRLPEAEENLLQAVSADLWYGLKGLAWQDLAEIYYGQGRSDEALQAYSASIGTNPTNASYRYNYAGTLWILARQRDPVDQDMLEQARVEAQLAVQYQPSGSKSADTLDALTLYGQICENLGRFDEARAAYNNILGLTPTGEWAQLARQHLAALP